MGSEYSSLLLIEHLFTVWITLRDVYMLLTSSIIPRPIAFISSLSGEGVPNLAPMR